MPSCKVRLCFKRCFSPWLPCQGMVGCFLDTLPVFPADPSSQTIQGGSASAGRGASLGVSAPQGGVMGTSSPSWRPQEGPSEGPRQTKLPLPGDHCSQALGPPSPLPPGQIRSPSPHPLMHQVLSGPTLSQQDKNHRLQIPTWIRQAWPQKPVEKFKTLSSKMQTGGPPGRRTSGTLWDRAASGRPLLGWGQGGVPRAGC